MTMKTRKKKKRKKKLQQNSDPNTPSSPPSTTPLFPARVIIITSHFSFETLSLLGLVLPVLLLFLLLVSLVKRTCQSSVGATCDNDCCQDTKDQQQCSDGGRDDARVRPCVGSARDKLARDSRDEDALRDRAHGHSNSSRSPAHNVERTRLAPVAAQRSHHERSVSRDLGHPAHERVHEQRGADRRPPAREGQCLEADSDDDARARVHGGCAALGDGRGACGGRAREDDARVRESDVREHRELRAAERLGPEAPDAVCAQGRGPAAVQERVRGRCGAEDDVEPRDELRDAVAEQQHAVHHGVHALEDALCTLHAWCPRSSCGSRMLSGLSLCTFHSLRLKGGGKERGEKKGELEKKEKKLGQSVNRVSFQF